MPNENKKLLIEELIEMESLLEDEPPAVCPHDHSMDEVPECPVCKKWVPFVR